MWVWMVSTKPLKTLPCIGPDTGVTEIQGTGGVFCTQPDVELNQQNKLGDRAMRGAAWED